MDADQIIKLFHQEINKKTAGKKSNYSKDKIYDYRHRSTLPLGNMLEFLFITGAIKIVANEHQGPTESES